MRSSPIEQAFAKLKAHLKRIGARTFDHLMTAIGGICDLQARIAAGFGVTLHERTVGKQLAALGFRRLSLRPQHPKPDPEAQPAFKKLPPGGSGGDPRDCAGQAAGDMVPR